jgi:tRNA(fMet)-specific endonuclease VapC
VIDPLYLLDSNICIYVLGGLSAPARARIEQYAPGQVVTSAVAYAEVLRGLPKSPVAKSKADAFFAVVRVLPFDKDAARQYLTIPFRRASYDRLIAAHALHLGLTFVTNDLRSFKNVPGLKVENWTRQ